MKKSHFRVFFIIPLLFVFGSCEKDPDTKSILDFLNSKKYYSQEIIPTNYQNIYGKWELYEISGGLSGTGFPINYDYLEIRNIGIYGVIKNDSLLEYGKIEINVFDENSSNVLQIKLVNESHVGQNPHMDVIQKYVYLIGNDTLNLVSPCCDLYNYHYKRIKH